MRKHKLTIVIECNEVPLPKLQEYLQFIVLPGIETGSESGSIKIGEYHGKYSVHYRALKECYKPRENQGTPAKHTDEQRKEFIDENIKDFKILTKLRQNTVWFSGKSELVKQVAAKARTVFFYSEKTSHADIVTYLHNFYIKHYQKDQSMIKSRK